MRRPRPVLGVVPQTSRRTGGYGEESVATTPTASVPERSMRISSRPMRGAPACIDRGQQRAARRSRSADCPGSSKNEVIRLKVLV